MICEIAFQLRPQKLKFLSLTHIRKRHAYMRKFDRVKSESTHLCVFRMIQHFTHFKCLYGE